MRFVYRGRLAVGPVGFLATVAWVALTTLSCEEFTPIDQDAGDGSIFDVTPDSDGADDGGQPDGQADGPEGDLPDDGGTPRTLTLRVSGPGEVTAAPGAITCAVGDFDCEGATMTDCETMIANGTIVTLTATGTDGGSLVRWEGAASCGSEATCDVEMTRDTTVTAVFGYGVGVVFTSICVDGEGSSVVSDPEGIETAIGDPGVSGALFAACTTVTLTATPMGAAELESWGGSCEGEDTAVCTLSMDAGHSVTASFPCAGGDLTVNVVGFGTVSSAVVPDIDCDQTNTPCVRAYNAVVELTATPSARGIGWTFSGWTGCPAPAGDTCTVDLRNETDHAVTATFDYDVSYAGDVYPLFSGSGCTTCHDSGHTLGLDFELPAPQVYFLLTQRENTNSCGHPGAGSFVVNTTPGQATDSLLLVYANPGQCAGPPPAFSHPGAVWALDGSEYETAFDWIDGGAPQN